MKGRSMRWRQRGSCHVAPKTIPPSDGDSSHEVVMEHVLVPFLNSPFGASVRRRHGGRADARRNDQNTLRPRAAASASGKQSRVPNQRKTTTRFVFFLPVFRFVSVRRHYQGRWWRPPAPDESSADESSSPSPIPHRPFREDDEGEQVKVQKRSPSLTTSSSLARADFLPLSISSAEAGGAEAAEEGGGKKCAGYSRT